MLQDDALRKQPMPCVQSRFPRLPDADGTPSWRWPLTLLWFLSLGAQLSPADGQYVSLVRDGVARASFLLPTAPHPDEELAALELQTHLAAMSGARLGIGRTPPYGLLPIRIGLELAPGAEAVMRAESDDSATHVVVVEPGGITLAGLTPEGTLFAAYELLEQLGCRWYMPGDLGTVIPEARTVTLPLQSEVFSPSFAHRHLQTVDRSLSWYRRQRLGGDYFPGAHGIPLLPAADFETEPELFALIDGERSKRQLCISHPEVLRRATAAVVDYFETHPESPWIGMGPHDGRGFCEDEGCRLLDSGEWDPHAAAPSMTDRYIWFFNRILEAIGPRFADRKVAFYAYATYQLPPRKHIPDPRIVPAFAPITLCRIHGLSNPLCPDRSFYGKLMAGWGALSPEIFERGYYFNLADPSFPFSKVHAIRDETVFAHGAGIKGWRVECMPSWSAHTPTLYVAARMMWDVDADVDVVLGEFYDGFFGPAASSMGEYLDSIDTAYRDSDCHTGASHCLPRIFDRGWRRRSSLLFDSAAAVAGDSLYAERVHIFRLGFDRLVSFLDMLEYRNAFDFDRSLAQLHRVRELTDQMIAYELADGAHLLWPRSSHSYLDRFWAAPVEQGYERTVAEGELVLGLPDEWDFLVDPTGVGEDLGWFRDGEVGGNWQTMPTSTASWSDRGLHYYKGQAWYRTRFEMSPAAAERETWLFFCGVDEAATVWLNGQLVGTSPGKAFRPFEFEVTSRLRAGQTNTLAVRITNAKLDEIGTGGITAPVLLWSPRP